MNQFDYRHFRNELAAQIRHSPREERNRILEQAKESVDYWYADFKYKKDRSNKNEDTLPDLNFDLDNEKDFEEKILILAKAIYNRIQYGNRKYDPYKGDMSCGEITDIFVNYLTKKGINAKRITRSYEIKDPDGHYDDSFGHVYFIIDTEEQNHIMVDPTYLQWIKKEIRQNFPPVLIIRYKTTEELKEKFKSTVPITEEMVLPFYFGFSSPEARNFFGNDQYAVISEERARIDG